MICLTLQRVQGKAPIATPRSWSAIDGKTFITSKQAEFAFLVSNEDVGTGRANNPNMKRKASKVGDRVIATRKMGSIRQGDAGKVVEVFPFHDWTNPELKRRAVRFDELPHDYVVSDDDLIPEPDPNAKKRDGKGRFLKEIES